MKIEIKVYTDNGKPMREVIRDFTSKRSVKWIVLILVFAFIGTLTADTVTKPNTFIADTVISASEVNANFDTLYDLVNGNLDSNNIAGIDASDVTSGTLDAARVPDLDASKITSGTIDPAMLPGVWVATGTSGADGTDSGQLTQRSLTFTKSFSESALRVTYCDTFRTWYSAPSAGLWKIYINGSPVPSGNLTYNFYVGNDTQIHRPSTLIGYITDIEAGEHTIDIYVERHPSFPSSDLYTGWDGTNNRWTIEVQEVRLNN